jgi:hypothetical protein
LSSILQVNSSIVIYIERNTITSSWMHFLCYVVTIGPKLDKFPNLTKIQFCIPMGVSSSICAYIIVGFQLSFYSMLFNGDILSYRTTMTIFYPFFHHYSTLLWFIQTLSCNISSYTPLTPLI